MEDSAAGRAWLQELPTKVQECVGRWSLQLDLPYEDSSVAIVFPATRADGSLGVLKIQFPHRESEQEAAALRCWSGDGAVRLFDTDAQRHAMLLERCEPGTHLSRIGPDAALEILAGLLPRLWVDAGEGFRSLRDEAAEWAAELPLLWERAGRPFEKGLFEAALEALDALPRSQGSQVLIHQDLHGDNVLQASREPWLAIDPKPLVGEREFGIAPIVRAYEFGHSRERVVGRLNRLTELLGLDRERARLWSLAQTLAWGFEGNRAMRRHVETARWLWQA
jgi:streptomycin 6-kinase